MDTLTHLETAFARAELAWGYDPGTKLARPRACQLEMRIAVGRDYLATRSDNDPGWQRLEQLAAELELLRYDPVDVRRCQVWQQAYSEFRAALTAYGMEQRRGDHP